MTAHKAEVLYDTSKVGPLEEKLVDFTLGLKYDDLPAAVVRMTKDVILDAIGCALGAYALEKTGTVMEFVTEMGGTPESTIIGGKKTSRPFASFANAELVNALDYDILGPLLAHVVPYVFPPCFVLSEWNKASGKDLITAVAIALEVGGRMGSSLAQHVVLVGDPPHIEESPRHGHTAAVFGGAAGAGKLLKLDRKQLANAIGIVGANTVIPGLMKVEYTLGPGVSVKYNPWCGWSSQLITTGAIFAGKGFTGDTTILDGEWGFWKIIGSSVFKPEKLVGGLGEVWHLARDTRFKMYPCCGCNLTGIDGIKQLMKKNNINPDDIDEIEVSGTPWFTLPMRTGTEFSQPLDSEFMNSYIFAVAAYYGDRPSPRWHIPATRNDPRVRRLMKRVKVSEHPRSKELMAAKINEGKLPSYYDVIVRITAKGKEYTTEVKEPWGSPANPQTREEAAEKFRENASFSPLKAANAEKALKMLQELEKLDDITGLTRLLRAE